MIYSAVCAELLLSANTLSSELAVANSIIITFGCDKINIFGAFNQKKASMLLSGFCRAAPEGYTPLLLILRSVFTSRSESKPSTRLHGSPPVNIACEVSSEADPP